MKTDLNNAGEKVGRRAGEPAGAGISPLSLSHPPPGPPAALAHGYKESLTEAMDLLAADPRRRFIGYGLLTGRAGGTLRNVPTQQIIETPVAENLMVGLAIGISLMGQARGAGEKVSRWESERGETPAPACPPAAPFPSPVVFIERMDFILNALDAIVNHLDKIERMSHGVFSPAVILRVVVGNSRTGLRTGATHTQDFNQAISRMVSFPVFPLDRVEVILPCYRNGMTTNKTRMLVEYKDLW